MKSLFKISSLSLAACAIFSVAAHAQQSAQLPVATGNTQAFPAPGTTNVANTGQISITPPTSVPAITNTAPQFLPQSPTLQAPAVNPTISAYGTPIYQNQQVPASQVQQVQTQPGQQLPQALPPLPQPSVARQVLNESGMFLTPNQIREVHREVEDMGRAAAEEPVGRPPRAETSSVTATLTPGSIPPVMRLYMNYPTSLVIVDNAGNPWPIENWAGGSSMIEIKRPVSKDTPEGASITLTPRTVTGKYTHGGLTLYLKGLAIPVSLTYVGGQPVVDQRLEVRIPARGPNTTAPTSFGVGPAANPSLLSLLDGVAPSGAKPLKVSGGLGKAWSLGNGRMLVRTPWVVISPGYMSGMKSADGTNVYEMEQVSELKAINEGKITSITIDY